MNIKKRTVMLTLTNRCNLNCVYCYEKNKNEKEMSFETAKRIIDEEILYSSDGYEEIEFDLFGGEPFLNFKLFQQIVEYICDNKWPLKTVCFTTTNGTLVHGYICNWLKDNSDRVKCALSLDGTRYMHNINRNESFDRIDIDFFRECYPEQRAKMTISNLTLPYVAEGVIFLHNKGFNVSANLAYGISWSNKQYYEIFKNQLDMLVDFYFTHPNIKPSHLFDINIETIGMKLNNDKYFYKYCGSGIHMCAYNVDGKKYPCQMFMPITKDYKKHPIPLIREKYSIDELDLKCKNCVINRICPTCIGMNYNYTGRLFSKSDDYCKMMRLQFKAISKLKYLQYIHGQLNIDEKRQLALLKAIQLIQNNL